METMEEQGIRNLMEYELGVCGLVMELDIRWILEWHLLWVVNESYNLSVIKVYVLSKFISYVDLYIDSLPQLFKSYQKCMSLI